ncbi:restriction endonuclease [Streptomyces griseus]|uniref:restriction endonuclease n=1 Tax=Streptomyces griseus TaxID=1911 RepID=UPI003662AA66
MNRRYPARRPPRRSASRRSSRPRRSRKAGQLRTVEILLIAAAVLWAADAVSNWISANRAAVLLTLLAAAMGAATLLWIRHRRPSSTRASQPPSPQTHYQAEQMDRLHHRDFEYAVRDLMIRDGCRDAIQVGGAGDNGADVKATDPYGRRWVIQCKHRRAGLAGSAVGTPDLHVLNGTGRPVHHGDVIVLVTNGRFTQPAKEFAQTQRLHLVDRATLAAWAQGQPLWNLLHAVPPPRQPGAAP